jgi:hypothetical protein
VSGAAVPDHDARPQDLERNAVGLLAERELGLELRALVRIPELLAHVELVLAEQAAGLAGHVCRGHVAESLEPVAAARELEHAARALDVDAPRLLEREVEGDGCGAVHHKRHLAAQPRGGLLVKPEAGLFDVARDRGQPLVRRQPAGGCVVVCGAHEREDVPAAAREKTRQHLSSHESRGAGHEHGAHAWRLSKEAPG